MAFDRISSSSIVCSDTHPVLRRSGVNRRSLRWQITIHNGRAWCLTSTDSDDTPSIAHCLQRRNITKTILHRACRIDSHQKGKVLYPNLWPPWLGGKLPQFVAKSRQSLQVVAHQRVYPLNHWYWLWMFLHQKS